MKLTSLLLLFSINALHAAAPVAATTTTNDDSKTQAKAIMGGVYESFVKVIPDLNSDVDTIAILKYDPANNANLIKDLTHLSEFFKSARQVEYFQRPGFRPSLDTMNSHLSDTINSVESNNFAFAQKRLTAVASLCITCHSQLSAEGSANAFGDAIAKTKRVDFPSDFAYGNYLYLVREFGESQKYLELAIDKSLKESKSNELYTSLRRIISIHTKISFNDDKAINFVDKYRKNPAMPMLAKSTLESWRGSLLKWNKFDPKKIKSTDEFIKTYLAPLEEVRELTSSENDITLLIASGVLSKHLNDNPGSKNTAEILYWLAIAERRLSNTYFFTLSDLYLKDCIMLFPSSPFAKRCYRQYEEAIEFGYSGSSGTDIPPSEKRELVRLKSLLKK